jgi:hypothetical protein
MANVKKSDRVQDTDIKRLNHVGLGLKAIADHLGCHPATITLRLKAMGIDPTDTRRSFMEQVFNSLTPEQQDWLSHGLFNGGINVKEYVVKLIEDAFEEEGGQVPVAAPVPVPELSGGKPTEPNPLDFEGSEENVGGIAYGPDDGPKPDQMVEPEKVNDLPTVVTGIPPKAPKIKFT